MDTNFSPGMWVETHVACKHLSISRATLFRRKKEGYFQQGTHFYRKGPGDTAGLLWSIEACRKVFDNWDPPKGEQG